MSSTITFPPRPPALKLPRASSALPSQEKWAESLAGERRRLQEDNDALRVREENLREYEARLRALQDEIESGRPASSVTRRTATPFMRPSSKAPFETDAALQVAWEKLHRARELLEAEQAHLRDERITTHEKEHDVERREKALAEREECVAARERTVAEAEAGEEPPQPVAAEHTVSAVTRITRAPFDMARAVFGKKR
jgi:hypothetical protein